MQRLLILTVLLCMAGCAEIGPDRAVAVSRQYIDAHHLPLPPGYAAAVHDAIYVAMNEAIGQGESFPCYSVTYTVRGKELYDFTIPRYTPRVYRFNDQRWMSKLRVVR